MRYQPGDIKFAKEKIIGIFRGVVEDNDDPLKAGRVRVRIWGLHTEVNEKKLDVWEGIPTDELPWAEPALPLVEGSVSGFGMWNVPVQGSHVFIFFEQGEVTHPIYFATVPGIPSSAPDSNEGFSDPDETYPLSSLLGEPDYNRLSRGVSAGTIVTTKNNNRDTGVTIAGGGSWSEPASPYNTTYPHNYVIATHGGIIIEMDSTSGEERLHLWHPSNSYIEIDSDGNMVIKNQKHRYEIVANNRNLYVKGNDNKTISGNNNINVSGGKTTEVGGDVEDTISGDLTITVSGTCNITATQINLN